MILRPYETKTIDRFREVSRAAPGEVLRGQRLRAFRKIVHDYYRDCRRDFPWRRDLAPYRVLVSEIMLQQTQTDRVAAKFNEFMKLFPTVDKLAEAPFQKVMEAWQGLGYNRRCVYLHRAAIDVMETHGGKVPETPEELIKLPGIGAATAASICVFAYDSPLVFIETNIRTVFLYLCFPDEDNVSDDTLYPLIEAALDRKGPREWYSALMDFGAMLKKELPNPGRRSAHYNRQSPFEGSRRQLRGRLLKFITDEGPVSEQDILGSPWGEDGRVESVLKDLLNDGLVREDRGRYRV